MRLSRASVYAIVATTYIAEHEQAGPIHGADIAQSCGIPPDYLRKILQQLARTQVLDSETGRRGGFTLRKPHGQTTLLEVVEAIDGPLNSGLGIRRGVISPGATNAKLRAVCDAAIRSTRDLLRQTTIEHLIAWERE